MGQGTSPNYLDFKLGRGLADLGRLTAESDDNLADYYVGEDIYVTRALRRDDPASIFIGPKGVGKTAVLQMVRLRQKYHGDDRRIIEIAPDDLAFNALINLQSRSPLLTGAKQNQWLFKSLWDYVLAIEIVRREPSSEGWFASLMQKISHSQHRQEQKILLDLAESGRTSHEPPSEPLKDSEQASELGPAEED